MKISVGRGSCGNAAGAGEVFDALIAGQSPSADAVSSTASSVSPVPVVVTGCIGMCYLEPIVNIVDGGKVQTFVGVNIEAANEILKYISGEENNAEQYAIKQEDLDVLHAQKRIALGNCGIINPENIDEYIERGGYDALKKCVLEMTPELVIEEMKKSGLGGRGGAGFPTWFKWKAARESVPMAQTAEQSTHKSVPTAQTTEQSTKESAPTAKTPTQSSDHETKASERNEQKPKKYVICNADEGDPGAFMDRAILEGDPHAVLEGMMIAAYAIGAQEGIVYVRAEYPLAIIRLELAMEQARAKGLLGENLFGSDFHFDIRIKAGAGAFVCGEETALIASLEGERGMPRLKPPFPAQKGYKKQPSNINNVETFANVPWIIRNGGDAFSILGTENSKGTKVFALAGKIAKGGLVEVPMGKTLHDVVFGVGGGIIGGKEFKAVQLGGPSGGCIPASLSNVEIDYKHLAETGAIMGSGGMVVMDETTCMVDIARFFLDFTCKESCGKCTYCRIGNRRMLDILERICAGEGREGDIELLSDLAEEIKAGSMCQLGMTAPNPVLTTIRYFRNEYEEHIINKKCPAKQCKALLTFSINDKCIGCTLCAKKCPAEAITGEVKKLHVIDMEKCIKCGKCEEVCRFDAVEVE